MGNKLKNLARGRNDLKKPATPPIPIEFTAAEKDKLEAAIEYLKSAIVNSDNLARIKEKMIETMTYRTKLMKDQKLDLKESFPFLFVSVELVGNK